MRKGAALAQGYEAAVDCATGSSMRVLLDPDSVSRGLRRVAGEILEHHRETEPLLVVGVRRGGVPLALALARWLKELEGHEFPVGSVDITLYRDDAATSLPSPRIGPSEIPGALDGLRVVLVDDVLFTGRTVRAAIDALMDYGRPQRIELAVLVDRGGRELPIRADYAVRTLEIDSTERIDVVEQGDGLVALVQPFSSPSIIPRTP